MRTLANGSTAGTASGRAMDNEQDSQRKIPLADLQSPIGVSGTVPLAMIEGVGAANGLATLNGASKVLQDPASKGAAFGVASLDGAGKLTAGQAPDLSGSYIPTSQKGAASGVASLTAGSLVVQDPANATATPTASKIVKADGAGKLAAGWGGSASTLASLDGGGKVPSAQITGVLSSAGLTNDAALEKTTNKGAVSGYAPLDAGQKLPLANQNVADKTVLPALKAVGFTGSNGAGACPAVGLPLNAKVLAVFSIVGTTTNAGPAFEATISVVNQIQQSSASDLSAEKFVAIVVS